MGTAALRTLFEPSVYLSDDKVGYIMFSETLANITSTIADGYVSGGYHIGFLDDNEDAAQAYAVPNSSFRTLLRAKTPTIDTLCKR